MKYQFVNINYDRDHIKLIGRGEDGNRHTFKVTGFEPYFFVENAQIDFADEAIVNVESGYKSLFGADLQKITVRDPLVVRRLRDFWTHHWEADIKFTRRFLIDKEIKSGFEIDSPSFEIYHDDIKSSDIQTSPITVFYDLEIDTPNRIPDWQNPIYPIIANTFYDTKNEKELS